MKKILFFIITIAPCLLYAQGIMTNGGKIIATPGSYITIAGTAGNYSNETNVTDGSIDNDGTISVEGSWTNNAANIVFINPNGSGKVIFNGTAPQNIGGKSSTYFEKLAINNSSGITLLRATNISDSLELNAGPLTLNSNILTIATSASSAISRTSGYIVSDQTDNSAQIVWSIGANSGAHIFPFGTIAGSYIPFVVDVTAGDLGNVTVSTYPTAANNTPLPATPVAVAHVHNSSGIDNSANTVDRFWEVDKSGPSGTTTLTFTADASEVGTISALKAQRWNAGGIGWDAPIAGQTNTATSATVTGVTLYTTWTMSGNSTPLPLALLAFNAVVNKDHVDLNWTTATETNNDYFTVEKTIDGNHYETVAIISGTNTHVTHQYTGTDYKPYNGLSYYRLKQIDIDGTFTYSKEVPVEVNASNLLNVTVSPNPSIDNINISIAGSEGESLGVRITDLLGKEYYTKQVIPSNNSYNLIIARDKQFPAGQYIVAVTSSRSYSCKKIILN